MRARFRNVPAWVFAEGLGLARRADVAYGGAFYAFVRGARLRGRAGERDRRSSELGREVKRELEAEHEIVHPDEPELRDIYGVVFWQPEGGDAAGSSSGT